LNLKVFFSCSGVGILNRGIESFFREAFDGLRGTEGLDLTLYKGAGGAKADERVLWNLPRTGRISQLLGQCIRRNGYVVEQLSTFPSMVRAIRRERPDVIFYSDSNLGFQLFRWRKQIGVPYRLLFSNGGPCHPPFSRTDAVHQVAPQYHAEALAAGEPPEKHFLLPYGIHVPDGAPVSDPARKRELRAKLQLPEDRPIVLSVGWIAAQHKRMDYVVREVAGMSREQGAGDKAGRAGSGERGAGSGARSQNSPHSRLPAPSSAPFLVLLGQMDDQSPAILELARRELGEANFTARSVPYEQVADYYRAADVFTLASLQEGFGRVYLEALIHGLPVIAHDHPVMRYVLGDQGTLLDLSQPGVLAGALREELTRPATQELAARRRESVRSRFSWPVLAPQYRDMFRAAAALPAPRSLL
jgi:1,2-diacylglycerol 3-alpha-glucosyltransferase